LWRGRGLDAAHVRGGGEGGRRGGGVPRADRALQHAGAARGGRWAVPERVPARRAGGGARAGAALRGREGSLVGVVRQRGPDVAARGEAAGGGGRAGVGAGSALAVAAADRGSDGGGAGDRARAGGRRDPTQRR